MYSSVPEVKVAMTLDRQTFSPPRGNVTETRPDRSYAFFNMIFQRLQSWDLSSLRQLGNQDDPTA